ncbi:MAG: hypothetical protein KGK35_03570 [Xanthomonadaceae bacterium]|nr:hypothetical protein [Xanthomonadaceae bacterium]
MQRKPGSIRNKLMLAIALVAAAVLATPAAMAHDYRGSGDDSGRVLGALVVGAVIGGVIASASQHDRYDSGYYYPAQSYPAQGYYESYPSYPAYSYGDGGYYSYPSYPSYGGVNVGVVYSSRGGRGYYGSSNGYYGHRSYGGHGGGSQYYGHRSSGGHGGWQGQGRYYPRQGH